MFKRRERLQSKDAAKVGRRGKSISSPFLRLKWMLTKDNFTRATVVVPLSFDKRATRRNKIKRQLREALSPQMLKIRPPVNLMVFASKSAAGKKFLELKNELEGLLRKARLIQ